MPESILIQIDRMEAIAQQYRFAADYEYETLGDPQPYEDCATAFEAPLETGRGW